MMCNVIRVIEAKVTQILQAPLGLRDKNKKADITRISAFLTIYEINMANKLLLNRVLRYPNQPQI